MAALLFAALAAAACSTFLGPTLVDRQFLSVGVQENGAPRPLVAGTRIRLTFSGDEIGASVGCNSMGGHYSIDGGRLVVDALAMTEMGCDPERQAQDAWLGTFLGSRPAVSLAGSDLTLDGGSTVIRLVDREVAEPDLSLSGPTWVVESIIDGDAVSSVPGGATASLVFHADGSLAVDLGCNHGTGTWRLDGTRLEVGPLTLTAMACLGAGADLEVAVLRALAGPSLAVSIEADVLTIRAGSAGLQLRGS